MPRLVLSDKYQKAVRRLTVDDRMRAKRYLDRLVQSPPPGNLNFKPMEGWNGVLWECRAGGQNRFILRRQKDEVGDYFLVDDIGPHDTSHSRGGHR
jgi:hypothetical protein